MKKGGTHVEVALSFVIFITFLVFVYYVLIVPLSERESKDFILSNFKENFMGLVSEDITIISINTESSPQNCVRLQNLMSAFNITNKIIVKNNLGNSEQVYVLGSDLEIIKSNDNNFLKIYHSKTFDSVSDLGETPCNQRTYEKGLKKTESHVFESKVIELTENYKANYESLKSNLDIGEVNGFGFSFTYANGTTIGTSENTTLSVYAYEFPVVYVSKKSEILTGVVNVRVW